MSLTRASASSHGPLAFRTYAPPNLMSCAHVVHDPQRAAGARAARRSRLCCPRAALSSLRCCTACCSAATRSRACCFQAGEGSSTGAAAPPSGERFREPRGTSSPRDALSAASFFRVRSASRYFSCFTGSNRSSARARALPSFFVRCRVEPSAAHLVGYVRARRSRRACERAAYSSLRAA